LIESREQREQQRKRRREADEDRIREREESLSPKIQRIFLSICIDLS
jgi:hypothetical protein